MNLTKKVHFKNATQCHSCQINFDQPDSDDIIDNENYNKYMKLELAVQAMVCNHVVDSSEIILK